MCFIIHIIKVDFKLIKRYETSQVKLKPSENTQEVLLKDRKTRKRNGIFALNQSDKV